MEEWRRISEFPRYAVSTLGDVMSPRFKRPLKVTQNRYGYSVVSIHGDDRVRVVTVHTLVASAFLGPKPPGCEVNHRDGIKSNNALSNLEWVTRGTNISHSYRIGLRPLQLKHSDRAISGFLNAVRSGVTITEASVTFGISRGYGSKLARGLKGQSRHG